MPFTPEQHKEYRKKLKARGICVKCHKEKTDGKAICSGCREQNNEIRSKHRKGGQRCYDCLNLLNEFNLIIGSSRCASCSEKQAKYKRKKKGWI